MELFNPWWSEKRDEKIIDWESRKYKWFPSIIDKISMKAFSLNFITGPRQVGKTTSLKILIHEQLKKERDKFEIFYYPCDEIIDYKELGKIIDLYYSMRETREIKNSLIILDEIQFTREWWRAIKSRIDAGFFKNDVIIITGSSSIEILKEKERFPGRRGFGKDLIMHPLSFDEYMELFNKNLIKTEIDGIKTLTIEEIIKPNLIYKDSIDKAFRNYLITGGFPSSINDFYTNGEISNSTRKTYFDWIIGDIQRANKNNAYAKEIFTYLLQIKTSPISWLSVSKNTSINSPHTTQDYIEFFRDIYLLQILYHIDPDNKINYRKNKKIHFLDPYLTKVLMEYTKIEMLDEHLVEAIIAAHFSRKFEVYFWKGKTEVDIIINIDSEQFGFEVKWGIRTWKSPRHLKNSILLTKDIIPLFLASIKWD